MLGLSRISISEFTRRIIERTGLGNWFLLIAPEGDAVEVAERVAFGLASEIAEGEVRVDRPMSVDEVAHLARRTETLVLAGIDTWPASEWARWDVLRGRLLPSHNLNLAFPNNQTPTFVRFDLNEAAFAVTGTRSAARSPLLCHVHPGHGHKTMPSPILSPQEVLDLVLRGHLR